MAATFCPVGPNMAAIFGPGPNLAAIIGPPDNFQVGHFVPGQVSSESCRSFRYRLKRCPQNARLGRPPAAVSRAHPLAANQPSGVGRVVRRVRTCSILMTMNQSGNQTYQTTRE